LNPSCIKKETAFLSLSLLADLEAAVSQAWQLGSCGFHDGSYQPMMGVLRCMEDTLFHSTSTTLYQSKLEALSLEGCTTAQWCQQQ
jgi:hypothetical protein